MKRVFFLLLFCLIFQNVLTSRRSLRMRMAKVAQALKLLTDAKEKKLRKLENTDQTSEEDYGNSLNETATDTTVQTNLQVDEYTDNSKPDEPESANATAANANVSIDKPVATKPKKTGDTKAPVQVTKIHGFSIKKGDPKVTFGMFFFFYGRPIVYYIIMRIRITYKKGLRNLQEETAESARTDCTIADESMAGKTLSEEENKNINYNCEVNATAGDPSTANFTLNTDVPMTMVNANGTSESLNFDEVNFNGDAAEETSSLQNNDKEVHNVATLTINKIEFDKMLLKLSGRLVQTGARLRNLALSEGQEITVSLDDISNNTKTYDCNVYPSSHELHCDTSSDPLRTTADKFVSAAGTSPDNQTLFTFKLGNNVSETDPVQSPSSNRYTYNKSSSGLSGGAIAGIVIACVVALAAASIAAIMLRKPSPPVDNTTIVDLKTETI